MKAGGIGSRLPWLLPILALLLGADLLLGSTTIPPGEVLRALRGDPAVGPEVAIIIHEVRLPKALTALLAGAALAVAGLIMQTLFRNPLAGPDVLGISAGASLGVALVVLALGSGSSSLLGGLGLLGDVAVVTAATAGAAAMLLLIALVAGRFGNLTVLILGLLLGYTAGAIVTVLIHFSQAERIQAFIAWTFGSFGGVTWGELAVLAPPLSLALLAATLAAKPLNALALGETMAATLGVGVARLRLLLVVLTAVLAGGVTAFCGPIAFIGIAVPHLARWLCGRGDHRLLLPTAALAGAASALLADILTQLPAAWLGSLGVLPLNAVTSLLGAPWIILLLIRRRAIGDLGG